MGGSLCGSGNAGTNNRGAKMKFLIIALSSMALFAAGRAVAPAAEDNVFELHYENRKFIPQTLEVPSGRTFRIKIINASKEAIEFESFKINREKVVGPGETVTVNIPALKPGTYDFYGDFHRDVPEGTIVAK
jgi:plastocyanin